MKKIFVEIEYSGSYPLLAQDVQWALQAQTPNQQVSVRKILPAELVLDKVPVCIGDACPKCGGCDVQCAECLAGLCQ